MLSNRFSMAVKIYETTDYIFYRSVNENTEEPVILKQIKAYEGSREQIACLDLEIKTSDSLNHKGVLRCYETTYLNERLVLVMEDFGGELLSSLLPNKWVDLALFLKVAINLTKSITYIHESGFVHFCLNPQNIWVNLQKAEVKVMGLKVIKEKSDPGEQFSTGKNSLYEVAYIAPEQTGRVSQEPDHRTDLYALGVIFYEMLAGILPFQSEDYAEVIHSHLARKAIPICKRDNHIPSIVSDIIEKLMEKRIRSRYQTAQTLLRDLEYCHAELSSQDGYWIIPEFPLGWSDCRGEIRNSEVLLGREKETARLLEGFEQVKRGEPVLALVAGYSGIGKTSLVNQIAEPIMMKGGLFLQGKFDQYKSIAPYEAFVQAFDSLFQDILTQNKDEILAWKERILKALSDNAGIITDIFPGLSKIIGAPVQTTVKPLSLSETQSRFNSAMVSFLSALTSEKAPLLIFLDDIQWADSGSISMLELIFSGIDKIYLYVIGAYRNNEISDGHPLQRLINRLRKNGRYIEEMTLEPLELAHVHELMAGMLRGKSDPKRLDALVTLCHAKTGGNPFFLHHFIRLLQEEGFIAYDPKYGGWDIHLDEILQVGVTDNVVTLMLKKIERLSLEAIDVLKLAACINNTFDLVTLVGCSGASRKSVVLAMEEAVAGGFVLKQFGEEDEAAQYRFLHDRIQQAFYSLTTDKQRQLFHYRIGCFLQEKLQASEQAEQLLTITNHFNLAENIIKMENETLQLTRLNLDAGKKAKTLSAHEQAFDYFKKGIALLEQGSWDAQYALTLELYTEGMQTAYVCAAYKEMEIIGSVALKYARTLLDKVKIYEVEIEYLTAINQLKQAKDLAHKLLESLGEKIPQRNLRWHLILEALILRLELSRHSVSKLSSLQEMTDEKQLTIMRLFNSVGLGGYTFDAPFLGILAIKAIRISRRYGIAPLTPVAFACYGHILCAYFKKREEGYQYGKLAMALQEDMPSKMLECKTKLVFEIIVRHNREPLANTLEGFPNNHKRGIGVGDLMSAGHIMLQYYAYLYLAGTKLPDVHKQAKAFWEDLLRTGNRTAIGASGMFIQGALNLIHASDQPWVFDGLYFNEEEDLPRFIGTNDRTVVFCTHFNKMIIAFLWEYYEEAMRNFHIAEAYKDGAVGTYCIPVLCFYGALLYLRRLHNTKGFKSIKCKKKMKTLMQEVKSFAKDAPQNNLHKYLIIQAEYARICEQHNRAQDGYRKAILMAQKNGFIQEEGLANELAAKYYLAMGDTLQAEKRVEAAIACYLKWGCTPKVKSLRDIWRKEVLEESAATIEISTAKLSLDMETIVQASQAISEEIVLHELLKKMIYIMLRHVGARRALFIMEREGEFYIEAEGNADNRQVKVMNGAAVRNNPDAIEKLINYVFNTRERVLLRNADEVARFTDETISQQGPRSLLCLPVESVRGLAGVLYLENNLMDGAFTQQHLLILKVLTSQLAISMENARLYQNMERIIENRTEELRSKNDELERANRKLEEASRIKNEFLARISHEMRTPLHGVIGMAGLLEKGELGEEQNEIVASIQFSARSLMEIINEILDLSKMVAGKLELDERAFHIELLIKELLPTFILRAKDKGIALNHKIERSSDKALIGDAMRIRQIITNLLSNAIKFTEQGKVELEVGVRENGEEALLEIRVCDTGIGIPADKLEAIFEEFVQVDSAISRTFEGTGLGLSITKQLAKQMKGDISVQSVLGQGSIFKCQLHLKSVQECETSAIEAQNCKKDVIKEAVNLHILVAEDNSINQRYIRIMLEYLGCEVETVAEGRSVLEMLKQGSYDCILMDKNMPIMDGVETTRHIREQEERTGGHIPIIALTASAIIGDREKLLAQGVDYYLSKPLNEAELYAILKRIEKTSGLIDQKTFLEEAEAYGKEIMAEIITAFLVDHAQFIENIETALTQGNYTASLKALHRLTSTVSIFYCTDFTDFLKQLERGATESDLALLKESLPKIKKQLNSLLRELATLQIRMKD